MVSMLFLFLITTRNDDMYLNDPWDFSCGPLQTKPKEAIIEMVG